MNLNQVKIPSHDLIAAVDFYKRLGLQLIVDSISRYARFQCPNSDATFSIHYIEYPIRTDGLTVYFECDDLDNDSQNFNNRELKSTRNQLTNRGYGEDRKSVV